jgi:hypothetical protein
LMHDAAGTFGRPYILIKITVTLCKQQRLVGKIVLFVPVILISGYHHGMDRVDLAKLRLLVRTRR